MISMLGDDEKDDDSAEQDELDEVDEMLDDLGDIEHLLDDAPRRHKKKSKSSGQKKKSKDTISDEEEEEDDDSDESNKGGKKQGDKEHCENCAKNAEKFVKDEFCRLADPENRGQCVVEAMKLVALVRDGKMTMHDFEEEVKKLGKKYVKGWTDNDDNKEVISDEEAEKTLGPSSERD